MNLCTIITINTMKGGVGKTTTAVNLAAGLAWVHKKRVLVVDVDPQANATRSLFGKDLNEDSPTVGNVLTAHRDISGLPSKAILSTSVEGLDILPSSIALSETELKLVNRPHRELLLREALTPIAGLYEYVVIDCPPNLGTLSLNGIGAANYVVVPCETQYLSLLGLKHVWNVLALVRERLNPNLRCMGVLPTKYDGWRLANREVLQYLYAQRPDIPVFNTVISRDVKAEEAPNYGVPLLLYAPNSRAAQDYLRLADEVIQHGQA